MACTARYRSVIGRTTNHCWQPDCPPLPLSRNPSDQDENQPKKISRPEKTPKQPGIKERQKIALDQSIVTAMVFRQYSKDMKVVAVKMSLRGLDRRDVWTCWTS
ncbi:hypothetical protein PCANC_09552 [Puccinia coronata f. sp. avenae]|uniref:Uncharacterized protein n=1 Tax=Puccinia coronata f. sp. avenae TaxID=200324 RepID=A0A2N5V518_9BASI|nr:hypothetical protein PCANC_09552 [Puccinia coronata f. sp. avenae]